MKKRNVHGAAAVLACVGLLLLAASLILAGRNVLEARQAEQTAQATAQRLRFLLEAASAPASPDRADAGIPAADPERRPETPAEEAESPPPTVAGSDPEAEAPMAIMEVDGYRYVGILYVPSLALELPVMESCSESHLRRSPCLYSGTATRNMVIAGHSYRQHFGALNALALGDTVLFVPVEGAALDCRVDSVEVLRPWQMQEMTEGDWDLTLFTCTPSGQARLAVGCARQRD